jgi:ribosomal protein S18 acetylase RimI-like enzyme
MNYFVAQEKHVKQTVALVNSAYRGESGKQGWTTESDLLDGQRIDESMFMEMLGQGVILLFGDEESPVGSAFVELQGDAAYIGMVTVSPLKQSQGFGKQILQIAEDFAVKKWAVEYAKMSVISKRTELLAYYERRGYVKTGETAPFPYGQEKFGIPKHDDLEFVIVKKRLINSN